MDTNPAPNNSNVPKWQQRKWDAYGWKHQPPHDRHWPQIVRLTRDAGYPAKYVHAITPAQQERLEIECTLQGTELTPKRTVRRFFLHVGVIIGASAGVETTFVWAEWKDIGIVHGRPISIGELRLRGAQL